MEMKIEYVILIERYITLILIRTVVSVAVFIQKERFVELFKNSVKYRSKNKNNSVKYRSKKFDGFSNKIIFKQQYIKFLLRPPLSWIIIYKTSSSP